MHTKKIINGETVILEAWLVSAGDIYKFGIQGIPKKSQPYSFSVRLSEEFIEDEIDNDKKPEYLESVALKVAENHIENMLNLGQNVVIGNIKWWFKEAKRQLEEKRGDVE